MQKNELLRCDGGIYRVLQMQDDRTLVIDCMRRTMPKWLNSMKGRPCSEDELFAATNIFPAVMSELNPESQRFAYEHYSMIAGVLPFIGNESERSEMICKSAQLFGVSRQTIRNNLCLFLAYQNISVLAPKRCSCKRPLSKDEKNIRWALNKFFYTQRKNSLQTAYTLMLKERYCDSAGILSPVHPTINQFRYFYRKHKSMQTYYISRDGMKSYQRNNRPLTGDGIQAFAPTVGTAMLDSTICDIFLVDDTGSLIGRPILTACVDAYSSLCCGYTISWEGGVYSLMGLMHSVIADKVQLCHRSGIHIERKDWDCSGAIPGVLVTDMGSEYKSEKFEQIAELGVTIINLPAYRPELKGAVEKFFDVIQGLFKPHLKGKGVIETDFRERGAHDYRKDACLTARDFETVILRCIIYYNSSRVVDAFPYTREMLASNVPPYASEIWNYGIRQAGAVLIPTDAETLTLTLLPRTSGKFSRRGLTVNRLRYRCEGFDEEYLNGGTVTAAYNPDDVSFVWLVRKGSYTKFTLIESRFQGESLDSAEEIKKAQRNITSAAARESIQAKIDLACHIQAIANSAERCNDVRMKNVRATRRRERMLSHIDYTKAGTAND